MKDDRTVSEKINQLIGEKDSNQLVVHSFRELIPQKQSWIWLVLVVMFSVLVAHSVAFSDTTLVTFEKIASIFNAIMIAVFGVVFTVFAIFQALLNNKYLKVLMESYEDTNKGEESPESCLQRNSNYMEHMIVCYFIGILIDVSVLIVATVLTSDVTVPIIQSVKDIFAFVFIAIYLFFNLWLLIELKSVIYNIAQLFRIYLMTKVVEIEEIGEQDGEEDNE